MADAVMGEGLLIGMGDRWSPSYPYRILLTLPSDDDCPVESAGND